MKNWVPKMKTLQLGSHNEKLGAENEKLDSQNEKLGAEIEITLQRLSLLQ